MLNPWEFIRAVRALGNGRELVCKGLEGTMPQGTIVVINMTASTTSGQPLSADEWQRVQDACDMAENLEQVREKVRHTFISMVYFSNQCTYTHSCMYRFFPMLNPT